MLDKGKIHQKKLNNFIQVILMRIRVFVAQCCLEFINYGGQIKLKFIGRNFKDNFPLFLKSF